MGRHQITRTGLTLVTALAGGLVFQWLGFPAAFLTGPALFVTLAALAGLDVEIPLRLRDTCFVILGINIGSTVTPDVISTIAKWPASFAVMLLVILLIIAVSRRVMQAGFGFDRVSAFMASVPGHLSYVLALSTDSRADIARVSLVQSIRVLVLTLCVPALLGLGGAISHSAFDARAIILPGWIAVLVVLTVALGLVFQRLALPAAFLLAGIAVTATAELSGTITGTLPPILGAGAFIVLGALIGTRFAGQSFSSLRGALWAGLVGTALAIGIAALGAGLVAWALDLPLAMVLIAFAPGGLETMAAMAIQTGYDPTFVAAHHVARLLMLTVLIPLLMRRL